MQTVEMRNSVISSVKRALLGEVSPALCGVTVGWDEKTITILCYYNRKISPEDREAMSCVETEVMADFPDYEIKLFPLSWNIRKPMKSLDAWVYRRSKNIPIRRRYYYLQRKGHSSFTKRLRSSK
ncbi:MAG TPA: hypothetical protein V6D28_10865 [Leptolyngbyaceae cyanobacterium]